MKRKLIKASLAIFLIVYLIIPQGSFYAQDKITIEFETYDDQRSVKLVDFPLVETRFRLSENGRIMQQAFDVNDFTIYEDNQEIKPLTYITEPGSIQLTILIDIDTYEGLPEIEDATLVWANKVNTLTNTNDLVQLCFTLGQPACKINNQNDFGFFFQTMREPIIDNQLTDSTHLSDILQLSLDSADGTRKVPVVVLIRDNVARDDSLKPEIPETFLARINRMGGLFIMIDENNDPSYEEELLIYLQDNEAYYYPTMGIPNRDGFCNDVRDCLQQHLEHIRPLTHILTYKSYLFQDTNLHEVRIALSPSNESRSIENTTAFYFRSTDSKAGIKDWVRDTNTLLALLSPLLLMLILVLGTNRTSEKTR